MRGNFFLTLLTSLVLMACSKVECSKSEPKATVVPTENNIMPAAVLSDKFQPQYELLPRVKGGVCAFSQPSQEGGLRLLTGWAAIAAREGVIADAVVLGVTFDGKERFTPVPKQKREDVAKYFNSAGLLESGFSAKLNLKDAPAGAVVTVYQVFQGKVYECNIQGKI